jgi:hypothetical protein
MEKVTVLREAGWDVLVVWECELKDRDSLRNQLRAFMKSSQPQGHLSAPRRHANRAVRSLVMALTLEQIRRKGLAALRRELGKEGMIRFLQQFETGRGDYARERHTWVDRTSLDDIRRAANVKRSKKK